MASNAQQYAETLAARLDDLDQRSIIEPEEVEQEITEAALELVHEPGEPFQVVLTLGGPDARLVWTASDGPKNAELIVTWGSDRVAITSDGIRGIATYWEEARIEGTW